MLVVCHSKVHLFSFFPAILIFWYLFYIWIFGRENDQQRDLLFDIVRSEHSMMDTALNSDPNTSILEPCYKDLHVYSVHSTGASITADSSVSLLYRYCEYFLWDPYFMYSMMGDCHRLIWNHWDRFFFFWKIGGYCKLLTTYWHDIYDI